MSSCKQEHKSSNRQLDEVEFQIDSTHFDYSVDNYKFYRMSIPHLSGWEIDTLAEKSGNSESYALAKEGLKVVLIFSNAPIRHPNPNAYYKKLSATGELPGEVLALDDFLKSGTKFTQLILKNEHYTIFKIIYQDEQSSEELDIYIWNQDYVEDNIRLTESIIAQLSIH